VVDDGITGLLVEPGSSEALARALLEPSDDTLREMGRRGRERWAEHFAMTRLDAQLRGLYARLVDAGGRPVPLAA
jgi:glycosyltransferase involved in cell wall biosynthesis